MFVKEAKDGLDGLSFFLNKSMADEFFTCFLMCFFCINIGFFIDFASKKP